MSDPNIKFYNVGFQAGAEYVLQYLAEVFEGVEDTDVWAEFFPDENKD